MFESIELESNVYAVLGHLSSVDSVDEILTEIAGQNHEQVGLEVNDANSRRSRVGRLISGHCHLFTLL